VATETTWSHSDSVAKFCHRKARGFQESVVIVDFVVTGSERPRRSMVGTKRKRKRALRWANHPMLRQPDNLTTDDEAMRLGAGSESNETQRELSQVGRVVGCQRLSSRRNKKRSGVFFPALFN